MLCIERLQSWPGRSILPGEEKDSRNQEEQSVSKTDGDMCHNHCHSLFLTAGNSHTSRTLSQLFCFAFAVSPSTSRSSSLCLTNYQPHTIILVPKSCSSSSPLQHQEDVRGFDKQPVYTPVSSPQPLQPHQDLATFVHSPGPNGRARAKRAFWALHAILLH